MYMKRWSLHEMDSMNMVLNNINQHNKCKCGGYKRLTSVKENNFVRGGVNSILYLQFEYVRQYIVNQMYMCACTPSHKSRAVHWISICK